MLQSEVETKQLQGLQALQGLAKGRDKVYEPLQRAFQVIPLTHVPCDCIEISLDAGPQFGFKSRPRNLDYCN